MHVWLQGLGPKRAKLGRVFLLLFLLSLQRLREFWKLPSIYLLKPGSYLSSIYLLNPTFDEKAIKSINGDPVFLHIRICEKAERERVRERVCILL